MAEFLYKGVDKKGKPTEGKLDAPSEGDVRMLLRNMGIRPTRITKPSMINSDIGSLLGGGGTIKLDVLIQFTRQLQVMIGSGVPLVQSLTILGEQQDDKTLQQALKVIEEKVSSGTFFWEAIMGFPKIFPKLYISLVKAGEASGALDSMLKRVTRYLEDNARLVKMMKGASIYPIMIFGVGTLVIGIMLVFVIPKFEEMLQGNGTEMPLPTKIVMGASHFMIDNIFYIVGALTASGFIFMRYVKSAEGRGFIDRMSFRLPLFGPLVQKAGVARFTRTLQTLLASGVNLLDAIDICKMTIDNVVLEEAVNKIRTEVETGKPLAATIAKLGVFPKMAVQMIGVGESTGSLDKMLEKVADFYEAEVESAVGNMTKMIEPLILLFLGVIVGGMMIAMYLPMFKMGEGAG